MNNENSGGKKKKKKKKKVLTKAQETYIFPSSWSEVSFLHQSYPFHSQKCCCPHFTHEKLEHNRSWLGEAMQGLYSRARIKYLQD